MPILIERGVVYDSSRITIPGVVENNCTLVRCAVFKFDTAITEFSDPVKLTIVGELSYHYRLTDSLVLLSDQE